MGLLDSFFGNADQTRALGLLGAGMMQGGFAQGAPAAMNYLAGSEDRRRKGLMDEMQLQELQQKMQDTQRLRQFQEGIPAPSNPSMQPLYEAARAGAIPISEYIKASLPKQLEFGKVDPKDYTPESLQAAQATGDYTKLVPVRKLDVVNNQAVDLYASKPGTVFDTFDPNKPFNLQGGRLAPNVPLQQYEMGKARAGATNVSVNTEKSLLNEIAGGLGKNMTTAQEGARSALGTINTVNRLNDALDSGKVMAGPGTTFRQYGLQVGNMLGISGKDSNERLLNTRQAIQSLAQLELDAAQQMKGQGQITEAEREIIRRAASGNIDGMTASELRLLGGVLDRTARSKIRSYNTQVKPLASNPNAAALAPFLNVEEPPERAAAGGVRRYNPATGRIE
jgi:hypothetical protein